METDCYIVYIRSSILGSRNYLIWVVFHCISIKCGIKVQFVNAISLFLLPPVIVICSVACRHSMERNDDFQLLLLPPFVQRIRALTSVNGKFTTTTRHAEKYALWEMKNVSQRANEQKKIRNLHHFPVGMKCYFHFSARIFLPSALAEMVLCTEYVGFTPFTNIKRSEHIGVALFFRLFYKAKFLYYSFFSFLCACCAVAQADCYYLCLS